MKLRRSRGSILALSLALGAALSLQTASVQAACSGCAAARAAQRPLPAEKIDDAYVKMGKKAQKNKEAVQKKLGDVQPQDLAAKAAQFPRVPHVLAELSPHGDAITFQDGSVWVIREKDQAAAKSWSHKAQLTVAPNASFFSKLFRRTQQYKYVIINLETGKSVQANLSKGPYTQSQYTRRIRRIDRQRGELYFTNGTLWQCTTKGPAKAIFDEWKVGDYVILGTNDSWFSFWKQDIIINVSAGEASTWLPATRLF